MVKNLLKAIHILEGLQQANTWEGWTCISCIQQRSATHRAGTRSWSGDSKNYWVRDSDAGDSGKYNKAADSGSNRGFCTVIWAVEETLGELCEVPKCLLWKRLRRHCPLYNVSCIFFNKWLYSSHDMAGYFPGREGLLAIFFCDYIYINI